MPTAAQVTHLFKPFLARHPDLVIGKRSLHIRLLGPISRMILCDRTSDGNRFRPEFYVGLLCDWPMSPWSTRLEHPPPKVWIWHWDNTAMPKSLFEAIEAQALPVLRAVSTFEAFADYVARHPTGWRFDNKPTTAMLFHAAIGEFDAARACARRVPDGWPTGGPKPNPPMDERYRLFRLIREHLLRGDHDAIAPALHASETANAAIWHVAKHLEPQPFPIETAS